ncbi:MAG: histone deacetylase family protein [Alphaproteobacteria bacterium]|nr:histone deacetylase family protein [Alphaproteobacteria bacterium]
MSTALFTHPACLGHDTGPYHPERSDRLRVVLRALEAEAFAPLLREAAPEASVEQVARVHPRQYVEAILKIAPEPGEQVALDSDTVMSSGSREAALRAAGAVVAAVDAVMEGWARNAFCAVRPPGHHAEPARPMGFCLFNNVAVGAAHARARWGLERVAVVDFDVHHGNGTQAMLERDGGFFYASSHQSPLYPGTGMPEEKGVGNILNVALDPGAGGAEFRRAWAEAIAPALDAFRPELLIISAGFDAHRADPLAALRVETGDFAAVTGTLLQVAERHAKGRVVSALEGGYDLAALAASAAAHVGVLMGH